LCGEEKGGFFGRLAVPRFFEHAISGELNGATCCIAEEVIYLNPCESFVSADVRHRSRNADFPGILRHFSILV